MRRSTSGHGLHIVAHLDAIATRSHTEHAALARAVLEIVSRIAGFDLQVEVDAHGAILWIWSRRATRENQGFASIKAATEPLSDSDLPSNWRDHLDVVTRRRAKVKVRGLQDEDVGTFDALSSALQMFLWAGMSEQFSYALAAMMRAGKVALEPTHNDQRFAVVACVLAQSAPDARE